MSERWEKLRKDLDDLILKGQELYDAIKFEYYPDELKEQLEPELGEHEANLYMDGLPYFRNEYQAWYSEALALVRQVLPDRLKDFVSFYEYPRARKELNQENYRIQEYLRGLQINGAVTSAVIVDGRAAIPEFWQQLNIVKSAQATFESTLFDISIGLQANLFDSEIDAARELVKCDFLRAAGAICGVVIEKHLKQVCNNHSITIRSSKPTLNYLADQLKDEGVIDVKQWRYLQFLADIRNDCCHARKHEPENEDLQKLISGTNETIKTIF